MDEQQPGPSWEMYKSDNNTSSGEAGAQGEFEDDEYDEICTTALRDHEIKINELPMTGSCPTIDDKEKCQSFNQPNVGEWIYPDTIPIKAYQRAIVESAIFENTLISLPIDTISYTWLRGVKTEGVQLYENMVSIQAGINKVLEGYLSKIQHIQPFDKMNPQKSKTLQILKMQKEYSENRLSKNANIGGEHIGTIFEICIFLSKTFDILETHGLRTLYAFVQEFINEPTVCSPTIVGEVKENEYIQQLLLQIPTMLNVEPEGKWNIMTNRFGTCLQNPTSIDDYYKSHPKLTALKNIMMEKLQNQMNLTNGNVRIFSQYPENVMEIANMMKNQFTPSVVRTMAYTGRGLLQQDQMKVVRDFKSGGHNVLVSSCTGEEGLDIGQVELMIYYDLSTSPQRLIKWIMSHQRRDICTQVVFLLSHGQEEKEYEDIIESSCSPTRNQMTSNFEEYLNNNRSRLVGEGKRPMCIVTKNLPEVLCTRDSTEYLDTPITQASLSTMDINPEEIWNFRESEAKKDT